MREHHEITKEMHRTLCQVVEIFTTYEEILSGILSEMRKRKHEEKSGFHVILSPLPHEGERMLASLLMKWARKEGFNNPHFKKGHETYGLKPLERGFLYSDDEDKEHQNYPRVVIISP